MNLHTKYVNSLSFATLFIGLVLSITSLKCSCQNPNSILLIENTIVSPLIDSISHKAIVSVKDGQKKWNSSFSFLDTLSLHKLTYLSDGLKVKGFMLKPKKEGKYPCIIWNRGGVEEYGAITLVSAAAMMGTLASKGYVVIGSQYRGNSGSEGQEEYGGSDVNDVLNLIDVLADIPEADTSRIGMFGGSRGGMMTYQAMTRTDKLKATAVLGAPSDENESIKDRPSLENSLIKLVANYEQNKEAELTKRSAIKWVDRFPKNVPLLIMHGNADWRVKSSQSLQLALELEKYRIPYRLMIFEGGDHGLSEFRKEFYDSLIAWFDKYLKNKSKLPDMEYHGN